MATNIPNISHQEIIKNSEVPKDENYQSLRIIRCQSNDEHRTNYSLNRYQFQHEPDKRTPVLCILTRKGSASKYRLVAIVHPSMSLFKEIVRYDPSEPPDEDYHALEMNAAHERTQQDFKGSKKSNTLDFVNYIIEGIQGKRTLYLPTITGWQSQAVFQQTIFVAFDEQNSNAMYGYLYIPKDPIMQADGQTQTAAIFQASKTVEAAKELDQLQLTLEIELNLSTQQAGQSFADRNGRGTNKNKNLIKGLDLSSALSSLRAEAIKETIFEWRLANGRGQGTGEKSTENIVDLSTIEQMLLEVISGGKHKAERIKHHHIPHFLPHCKNFLNLLEDAFGKDWIHPTPSNQDPFRKIYVHAWPFCLKAIAKAYHEVNISDLSPLSMAIGKERDIKNASLSIGEKYEAKVQENREISKRVPPISLNELRTRLEEIDWLRYRQHWISITSHSMLKGAKKTFILKSTGETVVAAKSTNAGSIVKDVAEMILSDRWRDLCSKENEPIDS